MTFPIRIPYLYNLNRKEKYLMINDINIGYTLCRRLGFEPNIIRLGTKEFKEIQQCTYIGCKQKDGMAYLDLPFKFEETDKESELTFVCNQVFDAEKTWKEIKTKKI